MDATPSSDSNSTRVFLSYARKDGAALAASLHEQLQARGHEVWQDVFDMHGGDDWWLQIEEQIGKAGAVLLVVTPAALASDIVRREWVQARRAGVPISPVTEDTAIFEKAPRWMRQVDVFVLAGASASCAQARERLYSQIAAPPPRRPVVNLAPRPPLALTAREHERNQILRHVLDDSKQNPVTRTVVVYGPPGFGKTTLVQDVCHLPEIVDAFTGGVLWAQVGSDGAGLVPGLNDMISALLGERVRFEKGEAADAAKRLSELLAHRDCLLVLDDVWDQTHIKAILDETANCARLITTRDLKYCMPDGAIAEPIGEMLTSEAGELLSRLVAADASDDSVNDDARQRLTMLARRLGEWPLLLRLTGGAIRYKLTKNAPLPDALTSIERALDARGLTAFDLTRSNDRDYAVGVSVGASLSLYPEDQRQRLGELAVLGAGSAFPQPVAERVWTATSGMPTSDAEDLLDDFNGTFLQQAFDRRTGANRIRFHDAIRDYLLAQLPPLRVRELHGTLLDSYIPAGASWDSVEDDGYIFDTLTWHLARAGRTAELYALTDQAWMLRQLRRTHSPLAFLDDVRAASGAAREEVPLNMVQVVRCGLIEATLRSSAGAFAPVVLSVLARLGQSGPAHDYAASLPEAGERAEGYRLIAESRIGQDADGSNPPMRELLEQAEAAAEKIVDAPRRSRLLGELANTVARAGETLWARRVAERALSIARTLPDGEDKTAAMAHVAHVLLRAGDRAAARTLVDEVVAGSQQSLYRVGYVGGVPVVGQNARALAAAASLLQETGDVAGARKIAEEGLKASRNIMRNTDPGGAVCALAQIARTYRRLGDDTQSTEIAKEAAALAARVDDGGLALSEAARAFGPEQAEAESIELVKEVLARARGMAPGAARMRLAGQAAGLLIDAGDRAAAAQAVNESMAGAWTSGSIGAKVLALRQAADALAEAGDMQRANTVAALALGAAGAIADRNERTNAWFSIGEVLAREGLNAAGDAAAGVADEARAWILCGLTSAQAAKAAKSRVDVDTTATAAAVDRVPDPTTRLMMSLNVAKAFTGAGLHDGAKRFLDRAQAQCADIKEEGAYGFCVDQLVSSLVDAGDVAAAARHATALSTRADTIPDYRVRSSMLAQAAHALAIVGHFDEARTVAQRNNVYDGLLRGFIGLAQGLSTAGRFDEVEALINETDLGYPENWPQSAETATNLVVALAEQGQAVRAVDRAKRIHSEYVASALHLVAVKLAERQDFASALEAAQAVAIEQGRDRVVTEVLSWMAETGHGVEAAARAETIASPDWKAIALARIARQIAQGGSAIGAAPLVEEARALMGEIARLPMKVIALCEVAAACSAAEQADLVRSTLADAILTGAAVGREAVFEVLACGARPIARLDKGATLGAVTDEVARVEQWWATPLPLPRVQ